VSVVNGERSDVSSRYQIIECPYKQAEYRKAGMLYYRGGWRDGWCLATGGEGTADRQKTLMNRGYTYAILVEEDDSPTTEDNSCD
jgi:hypothetical protein